MPPTQGLDLDQLDRYFAGELSSAEMKRVRAWFTADEATADQIVALRHVWAPDKSDALDVDQAWEQVRRARTNADSAQLASIVRTRKHRIGVAILLAASAVLGFVISMSRSNSSTDADEFATSVNAYTTPNAQRAVVTLLDGTKVTLNVASHLEVPKGFGSDNRTVYLNGEAYFEIAHTTGIPFIVKTFNTQTRVLGTEFGVRAYTPTEVRVAVRSGKVDFNAVTLTARDVAWRTAQGTIDVIHAKTLDSLLAFTQGQLIIDGTLGDVIPELSRWYNADIQLGDSTLSHRLINGTFAGNSLSDLAAILQLTFHIHVVQRGRTITLFEK